MSNTRAKGSTFPTYRCHSLGGETQWGLGPSVFLEDVVQGRRILVNAPENLQRIISDWDVSIFRTSDIVITELEPSRIGGLPGALMSIETVRQAYNPTAAGCGLNIPDEALHVAWREWRDLDPKDLPLTLHGHVRVCERITTLPLDNPIRIWGPPGIIAFIQEMAEEFCGSRLMSLNLQVVELRPTPAEQDPACGKKRGPDTPSDEGFKKLKLMNGEEKRTSCPEDFPPFLSSLVISRPRGTYVSTPYPSEDGKEIQERPSAMPLTMYLALLDNKRIEIWAAHQDNEGTLDVSKAINMGVDGKHIKKRKALVCGDEVEIDGRTVRPSDVLSGGAKGPQWILSDCHDPTDSFFLSDSSAHLQERVNTLAPAYGGKVALPLPNRSRVGRIILMESQLENFDEVYKRFDTVSANQGVHIISQPKSRRVLLPVGATRWGRGELLPHFSPAHHTGSNEALLPPVPDYLMEALDTVILDDQQTPVTRKTGHKRWVMEVDEKGLVKKEDSVPTPNLPFEPHIIFGGTSSAMPTVERNVTSIFVHIQEFHTVLFDVGEGTTSQFIISQGGDLQSLRRIKTLVISHCHADHFNGLPVLLQHRQAAFGDDAIEPLEVVGPAKFRSILAVWSSGFPSFMRENRDYLFRQFEDTPVRERGNGQVFGGMRLLGDVVLGTCLNYHIADSRSLRLDFKYTSSPYSLVFSGDIGANGSKNIQDLSKGANLLIHEATFQDGEEEMAANKRHSTPSQAVSNAVASGIQHLILTHFSARHGYEGSVPDLPTLVDGFAAKLSLPASEMGLAKEMDHSGVPKATIDIARDLAIFPLPDGVNTRVEIKPNNPLL